MKTLTEMDLPRFHEISKARHLNIDRPTELVKFTTTTTPPQPSKSTEEHFQFPYRVDYCDDYDREGK